MISYPRYAIYYAPPSRKPLARFGAALLGYDALSGNDVAFPKDVVAATPDWHDLTQDPRKYGFHATLKAPFALAPGTTEAELLAACADFARQPREIPLIKPAVHAISGFIAVVPAERSAALQALAQDCVEAFDTFRAPLSAEDRARRKPEALTARQLEQLDRWGYPYVGEDFRFHMTLTGRMPDSRHRPILAMLRARLDALALTSLAIDRIALFRQDDADSRFRIVKQDALTAR
jgi:putative phosphonate metabolism protein